VRDGQRGVARRGVGRRDGPEAREEARGASSTVNAFFPGIFINKKLRTSLDHLPIGDTPVRIISQRK